MEMAFGIVQITCDSVYHDCKRFLSAQQHNYMGFFYDCSMTNKKQYIIYDLATGSRMTNPCYGQYTHYNMKDSYKASFKFFIASITQVKTEYYNDDTMVIIDIQDNIIYKLMVKFYRQFDISYKDPLRIPDDTSVSFSSVTGTSSVPGVSPGAFPVSGTSSGVISGATPVSGASSRIVPGTVPGRHERTAPDPRTTLGPGPGTGTTLGQPLGFWDVFESKSMDSKTDTTEYEDKLKLLFMSLIYNQKHRRLFGMLPQVSVMKELITCQQDMINTLFDYLRDGVVNKDVLYNKLEECNDKRSRLNLECQIKPEIRDVVIVEGSSRLDAFRQYIENIVLNLNNEYNEVNIDILLHLYHECFTQQDMRVSSPSYDKFVTLFLTRDHESTRGQELTDEQKKNNIIHVNSTIPGQYNKKELQDILYFMTSTDPMKYKTQIDQIINLLAE